MFFSDTAYTILVSHSLTHTHVVAAAMGKANKRVKDSKAQRITANHCAKLQERARVSYWPSAACSLACLMIW